MISANAETVRLIEITHSRAADLELVPPVRCARTSPALQAGAFTRLASEAKTTELLCDFRVFEIRDS